ncbi:MAG: 3-oxoacyl-[acyl-carrier-protein] synthase 3 [Alphaproteobacteria bacterium MarineAlpha10_Bin3]|jgi:3-oxoacyl-[acyl-carrier-protein] synthase-3|nr:MAG: 3-oxoacyl-[acyl-carrier-protein] synthase 3 [Alphaproteobacteria bacterium MarineAlpha10_Bin3]PPR72612.1 MAG: 3-oxoacyl-[acyl-carrier-protein] synthase 3 [Alphaproteobacteria bacterium MarineAlpha4_Bin1]
MLHSNDNPPTDNSDSNLSVKDSFELQRSVVLGCGAYLPERVLTNTELSTRIDTSDEWIRKRTGIEQRHIAADGELTSDLAAAASRRALAAAGVAADEVDLIVLATSTPDNTFPATSTRVQAMLGIKQGVAFDVQAVCSGFVYALSVADNMLRLGQARTALVIGAEVFSRILDWKDRSTCVLFGDGAGAVVLRAMAPQNDSNARGILSTHLFSDGAYYDSLYVDGGPASTGTAGFIRMDGKEVFRQAVNLMSSAVETAVAHNGMSVSDIDLLVPHQANIRIIDGIGRRLGVAGERVVVTVQGQANTSAATIPLALTAAQDDKRIHPGDIVALCALGGGFAWGSALIRW